MVTNLEGSLMEMKKWWWLVVGAALALAFGMSWSGPSASEKPNVKTPDASAASYPRKTDLLMMDDDIPQGKIVAPSTVPGKWFDNVFGYDAGWLIHNKWLEPRKAVAMNVTQSTFTMACPKPIQLPLHVGGTAKITITLVGAYNPSVRWEKEFHREVALWDGSTNTVGTKAVQRGVETTLAQYRDTLCGEAHRKSAREILEDPTLPGTMGRPFIESFGARMKREQTEWDIRLHSITASLDADSVTRIAAAALKPQPPVAVKRPVKRLAPVTVKPSCGCTP